MEYMKHDLFSETEVNSAFKNLLIFIRKKTKQSKIFTSGQDY